ncbi:MAG: acetyl-transferase [Chlorobi bacterium]|nr:acetyl-transferase [Chlorobiota bacterium]
MIVTGNGMKPSVRLTNRRIRGGIVPSINKHIGKNRTANLKTPLRVGPMKYVGRWAVADSGVTVEARDRTMGRPGGTRMDIDLREEPLHNLEEYASIPIAFTVGTVLDVTVEDDGAPRFVLSERRISQPYLKDYDAIGGEHPGTWEERFDLSSWGMIAAYRAGMRVGGAVIAFNTAGVDMLEGRDDLAVLWDIRVAPDARGTGVGSALFRAVEQWAVARSCGEIKVETQNINVPACRFYARQGCVLRKIDREAYAGLPDEVQLLWYKDLLPGSR